MNNFKKSQILILLLLAGLLLLTPLLSSSLRTKYMYFIINLLIIALGAEAGLLSSLLFPPDSKMTPLNSTSTTKTKTNSDHQNPELKKRVLQIRVMEKSASEKISGPHVNFNKVIVQNKVKKCPSTPSLFFIGAAALDHHVEEEEEEEEHQHDDHHQVQEGEEISGQELFTKAETFIGNFYKQLKMQREDSWKRIQDFYHKPF